MELTNRKILVAFFSHTGENYSNGKMVELSKGNTHIAAEMIRDFCDADIYEIKAVHEYPHDYKACVEMSMEELRANARPELAEDIDVATYDVIFLGFPIWCGTMPMPAWTFLENHDFTGKVIMPFSTHEGSKMANSEADVKKLAPNAIIKNGLPIHGSSVQEAMESIKEWIEKE